MVKNLPAMQETQVRTLGQKDPLEKEMATHSSILAWEIPWTEEPPAMAGGLFTTDLTGKPIMEYYSTLKRRKLFHLQ